MKKKLFYFFIIIAFYYLFSVFFTKSGQFIQFYHSYSNSKEESQKKDIYITDQLNISYSKDSADIVKKHFDIWLDKSISTKQFGLLPIRFSFENEKYYSINIDFKPNTPSFIKENINYKFNNEYFSIYTIVTHRIEKGKKLNVDFYFKKKNISSVEIIPSRSPKSPDFGADK